MSNNNTRNNHRKKDTKGTKSEVISNSITQHYDITPRDIKTTSLRGGKVS